MTALLRWARFWKREDDFRNYCPGRTVKVTAFYSASQVQTYIPEIDVALSFSVGPEDQLIAEWHTLLKGRHVEDLARMTLRPQPEVRVNSVGPQRAVIEDYQPLETDVLNAHDVESFSFTLPELIPPDAVRLKTVPEELDSLRDVVRQAMIQWLCPEGTSLPEAIIPYFEANDPCVYVAVDGTEFQRGYFLFRWRGSKWIPDSKPWWPQRLGRDEVIELVKRYALGTVKTDCPQ